LGYAQSRHERSFPQEDEGTGCQYGWSESRLDLGEFKLMAVMQCGEAAVRLRPMLVFGERQMGELLDVAEGY
jgi:hypothetical protein